VGLAQDKFPLDHYIVIEITKAKGSFINYTWNWDDGTIDSTFNLEYHLHKYAGIGM